MGLRVLITGAGGDSAQGVIRALRNAEHDYVIASVCINKYSAGLYMSDISEIAPPISREGEYIAFLIQFINKHSIDIFIPTIDSELILICKYRKKLEAESNVRIITGSLQDMVICSDKLATSEYLKSKNISQPETLTAKNEERIRNLIATGEKVIMKPRFGGGSKGIRILDSTDLQDINWLSDAYIYQHFDLYSKEFTSVVMKDGSNIAAIAVFERILVGGRTMWCKRVPAEDYELVLRTVSQGLDIPYLNIQFGMVGDSINVFDLNPRFSGSTSVFAKVFNGPHLLVQKYFSGIMPEFSCTSHYFESVRYYDDLIQQL
jgi:carbamoyl-phosphate synthase large subunit